MLSSTGHLPTQTFHWQGFETTVELEQTVAQVIPHIASPAIEARLV